MHTCELYEAEVSNCMSLACRRDRCVDNHCFVDVPSKEVYVHCSVKRAAHHFPSLSPCLVCTYQRSSSFMPIKSVCSKWDKYQMKYEQSAFPALSCPRVLWKRAISFWADSLSLLPPAVLHQPLDHSDIATGLQYTLALITSPSTCLINFTKLKKKNVWFGMTV